MNAHRVNVLVIEQARGVWGAQRYLLRLAPLLRERGIDLTLAGPEELELHRDWRDAGFKSIHLEVPTERSIRSAGRPSLEGIVREARTGLTVARRIAEVARDGSYDALWANAHWTHVDTSLAGRMCRTPVVLHLHEEALPGMGRLLRSGAVSLATRSVAVSHAVAAGLPRLAAKRVSVIPNGVDTQVMTPSNGNACAVLRASLGIVDSDVMLLAATRLDPSKRIEDLIDCVARIGDRRVRLVVAGETSVYPDYERQVRAKAAAMLPGMMTFCGNRTDMVAMFGASDVVIHAGTVEGMPLTVVEAQACGKPVIAYDVSGVAEALVDGSTGILVPPCDVAALIVAVRRLADDVRLRTEMGTAARRNALIHHDIGAQADANAAVLKEMYARSGADRRAR